jgi:hypothetical protein
MESEAFKMTLEDARIWEIIFKRTRDEVEAHSTPKQQLTFNRFADGFEIIRKSPYLRVQRWVDVNGSICGSMESRAAKSDPIPTLNPPIPLKDVDEKVVTIDDVVSGTLTPFLDLSEN